MLAHVLLNELFNLFPILFHVKVCVGAMLNFQKRKSDFITNKHEVARFDYF